MVDDLCYTAEAVSKGCVEFVCGLFCYQEAF